MRGRDFISIEHPLQHACDHLRCVEVFLRQRSRETAHRYSELRVAELEIDSHLRKFDSAVFQPHRAHSETRPRLCRAQKQSITTAMRIIVTGLVGQYAFGGVAWNYLQYESNDSGRDAWYRRPRDVELSRSRWVEAKG